MSQPPTMKTIAPPHPTCAQCLRPVERIEWFDSPDRAAIEVRAHCNGQIEETCLPLALFMDGPPSLGSGTAFSTPRLGAGEHHGC